LDETMLLKRFKAKVLCNLWHRLCLWSSRKAKVQMYCSM